MTRLVDFAKVSRNLRNFLVSQLRGIGSAKFYDMRSKFLFLLESTNLLKIAVSGWLLQLKLKVSLVSSDVFLLHYGKLSLSSTELAQVIACQILI